MTPSPPWTRWWPRGPRDAARPELSGIVSGHRPGRGGRRPGQPQRAAGRPAGGHSSWPPSWWTTCARSSWPRWRPSCAPCPVRSAGRVHRAGRVDGAGPGRPQHGDPRAGTDRHARRPRRAGRPGDRPGAGGAARSRLGHGGLDRAGGDTRARPWITGGAHRRSVARPPASAGRRATCSRAPHRADPLGTRAGPTSDRPPPRWRASSPPERRPPPPARRAGAPAAVADAGAAVRRDAGSRARRCAGTAGPVAAARRRAAGPLVDRDSLTQAWGDGVLRNLPARAKALFSAGRFVAADESGAQIRPTQCGAPGPLRRAGTAGRGGAGGAFRHAGPAGPRGRRGGSAGGHRRRRSVSPGAAGRRRVRRRGPMASSEAWTTEDPADLVAATGGEIDQASAAEARLLEAFPGHQRGGRVNVHRALCAPSSTSWDGCPGSARSRPSASRSTS